MTLITELTFARQVPRALSHSLTIAFYWLTWLVGNSAYADINVLFLGDNGPHSPRERFEILEPVLRGRGIKLSYTDDLANLDVKRLKEFDALLVYANIDEIAPSQEKALLDYVATGGGFVPIHCASYCFRNSKPIVELIGAQFKEHGWARMREIVAVSDHPIARDYSGFESLDETYVHHRHNERDRTVLTSTTRSSVSLSRTARSAWPSTGC